MSLAYSLIFLWCWPHLRICQFRGVRHWPLLRVLFSCQFSCINALRTLSSCGDGHMSRYETLFMQYGHLKICPFSRDISTVQSYSCDAMATSQDMPLFMWYGNCITLFLWCWPHLKICPFSCDMATAYSYSCDVGHISRYAPFHVIWPLQKIIPVMLATSENIFWFCWRG